MNTMTPPVIQRADYHCTLWRGALREHGAHLNGYEFTFAECVLGIAFCADIMLVDAIGILYKVMHR